MKRIRVSEAALIVALSAAVTVCSKKDLDQDTDGVVNAENEAANRR